jgi:citrate synthase
VQYALANKLYPSHPLVQLAELLRERGPKVLSENPKISSPYPNVDAISGTLLTAAGFPYPEYYTVLFAMARAVGIAIQIVYERCQARGGKGTPIVRPKFFYKAREGEPSLASALGG